MSATVKTKTCSGCGLVRPIEDFYIGSRKCPICLGAYRKEYRDKNLDTLNEYRRGYYQIHKEELIDYAHRYYQDNNQGILDQKKMYAAKNSDKIKAKSNVHRKKRRDNDPVYRLRALISRVVHKMLVANGSSKNGGSILDFLPFSMDELKQHFEKQFEPWMTWDNQGKYSPKTWDDNDPNTWKWNIDHIIPQSDLPYTLMSDDNFKKCWSLENLRPLSAKQNILDGTKRIRHGKVQSR